MKQPQWEEEFRHTRFTTNWNHNQIPLENENGGCKSRRIALQKIYGYVTVLRQKARFQNPLLEKRISSQRPILTQSIILPLLCWILGELALLCEPNDLRPPNASQNLETQDKLPCPLFHLSPIRALPLTPSMPSLVANCATLFLTPPTTVIVIAIDKFLPQGNWGAFGCSNFDEEL